MNVPRAARLGLGLAWLCAAAPGCATFREPGRLPEPEAIAADDPLLGLLVSGWENTVAQRSALRGGAALKLSGPGGSERLDQNVVLARPARLRMEIQAFLVTAAVLVVDGGRYDYYQSVDDIRDSGPLYPGLLYDIAGVPLRLDQAVHFLLGAPPPRGRLAPAGGLRHSGDVVEVDLQDAADRLVRRLRFDPEGRLLGAMEWAPGGELLWRVGYDRYRQVGVQSFAHRIEFEFPRFGSRATVAFRSVDLDPELPDAVFRLETREDAEARAR